MRLRDGPVIATATRPPLECGSEAPALQKAARASRGLAFRFNEIRDLARGVRDACFCNPFPCNTLRDGAMGTPPPPSRRFGAEAPLSHSTNGATPVGVRGDCFGFPPAEQAPPNWVWPERHSPRQSGSKLPHSKKRRGRRAGCLFDSTRCAVLRGACAMPVSATHSPATRYAMARWVPPPHHASSIQGDRAQFSSSI